jgi:hypothetical protein
MTGLLNFNPSLPPIVTHIAPNYKWFDKLTGQAYEPGRLPPRDGSFGVVWEEAQSQKRVLTKLDRD